MNLGCSSKHMALIVSASVLLRFDTLISMFLESLPFTCKVFAACKFHVRNGVFRCLKLQHECDSMWCAAS